MNIDDLKIEEEIIPLFNISINKYSLQVLRSLFFDVPGTQKEAEERQEIIRAFSGNLERVKNIYSYKTDIEESYTFSTNIVAEHPILSIGLKKLRINFLFHKRYFEVLSSKAVQMMALFNTVYKNYFQNLKISDFPILFRSDIRFMIDTLNMIGNGRYAAAFASNQLSQKLIAEFLQLIFFQQQNNVINKFWKAFFLFESYLSIATVSKRHGFCIPSFIRKGIYLTEFFHPLLKNAIKNSVSIEKNVVLLTGPNMSGKSTFLRSISLCLYLSRIGMPIPSDEGKLPFVSDVNVFINSKDNLEKGYSHFMLEVQNLKQVILASKKGSGVAVFDEIFKGTNVEDAINILNVTLKGLRKFPESYFFISTHLYQFEQDQNEFNHIEFYYLESYVENAIPKFRYAIKPGRSDLKFGTLLFTREGLMDLLG